MDVFVSTIVTVICSQCQLMKLPTNNSFAMISNNKWSKNSNETLCRRGLPQMAFPLGDPGFHLTHTYLGPPQSTSQTTSRSVQPLQHSSWLCSTDKQAHTHRQETTEHQCLRCSLIIIIIIIFESIYLKNHKHNNLLMIHRNSDNDNCQKFCLVLSSYSVLKHA